MFESCSKYSLYVYVYNSVSYWAIIKSDIGREDEQAGGTMAAVTWQKECLHSGEIWGVECPSSLETKYLVENIGEGEALWSRKRFLMASYGSLEVVLTKADKSSTATPFLSKGSFRDEKLMIGNHVQKVTGKHPESTHLQSQSFLLLLVPYLDGDRQPVGAAHRPQQGRLISFQGLVKAITRLDSWNFPKEAPFKW